MFEIIILGIGVIVTLFSGFFVYSRNPRKAVNILYLSLTLSLSAYIAFNFLSLQTDERLLYIRLVISASTFAAALLYYLLRKIIDPHKGFSALEKVGVAATLLIGTLNQTELVFSGLTEGSNPAPIPNIAVSFFLLHLIIFLGASFSLLIKSMRNASGIKKLQYRYMLIAITPMLLIAPITGFVIPVLYQNVSFVVLNPLYSIFFVLVMGYLIVRHKLFDVKLIVARTIGYFLSVFTVALLFSFGAFLAVNFLTDDEVKIAADQQILFTLVAVGLAFVFQPVKRFFDRLSNNIFYRDAYDPQDFLDELNKVLVSRVDVEPLLTGSVDAIKKHLKANFVTFYLRETQYIEKRFLGDSEKNFEDDDIEKISVYVSQIHKTLIVADELEDDNSKLKDLLQKYDIAAIARLVTTVDYDLAGVGYLILGPKRSGSPYSGADTKVLEIVANELVIAIQNALRFEEIEEFNATLQKKVDEATKKLRNTNKKLEEMDETKDEFISMASHQLRTPLTSVKGYLSMVLEGDAGDIKPMQERLLSQAFTSSQRMVYLIADLLNVSRLRTGRFIIEKIRANLADIAEGEVAQLKETAASRSLELELKKPDNIPDLMLDETKMRQVIMNFIDNAIYYTPSGGKITVEIVDKDDTVELTVTDSGMGVPKADQQHLFTKFYRAGNARKARPDGTGLGLFMAKKVIVEQGGAIIFKSKEGEGSTFGFTLPKKKLLPENNHKKSEKSEDN